MFTACKYCGESKRVKQVTAQHGGRELLFKRATGNRENNAMDRISRIIRMFGFCVFPDWAFFFSGPCSMRVSVCARDESVERNLTYSCRFRSRGNSPLTHRFFSYSAKDFDLIADSGAGSEHISANTQTPYPQSQRVAMTSQLSKSVGSHPSAIPCYESETCLS